MRHWPIVPLGELFAKKSGAVDPSKFPDEDFDLYSIPAFDSGQPEVRAGSEIGSTKQLVSPNDVLLSRIVPHIRRAWVVGENRGRRLIASGEWIVFRNPEVHPRYLRFFLVGDPFHARFMQTVSGVGGSLLRAKALEVAKIQIPLPPLTEQERVVKLLDQADELRRLRVRADRRAADLIPALFHEMFGDPIKNSKAWQVNSLAKVGTLDRGRSKNRPRDEPSLYGGKYPFIQTGDVANANGTITSYNQTYSEKGLAQSRMWPAGTLCITIAANIGKTAILTFPACFPDSLVGFVPGETVVVEYVRQWLVTMEKRLDDAAPQMAQKNINLKILSELEIPVPPLPLQEGFAKCAAEIRDLEATQAASRERLDALFQSMLHRAFNGEL